MVWSWLFGKGKKKPATNSPLDAYLGLRNLVLTLDPDRVGAGGEQREDAVWGVLMEFCVTNAQVTLAGLADGTTSMYLSSGGGIIGAGSKPAVAEQTRQWLQLARHFVSQTTVTTEFPVVVAGQVQFYLLTPHAKRVVRVDEEQLRHGEHPLCPLFAQGHEVLAAVRIHSQSK